MDLFQKLKVKKDQKEEKPKHPNFMAIKFESDKKLLNSWVDGIKDKDGKFIQEFQTTFNSMFWETYLYGLFKEYSFKIEQNYKRPDFVLQAKDIDFIVEATTLQNSEKAGIPITAPEWIKDDEFKKNPPEESKSYMEYFNEAHTEKSKHFSMIGILGSFKDKLSAYNQYHKKNNKNPYNTLDYVKEKPFIVALAPFEKPFHFYQYDELINAVLYNDYIFDSESFKQNPEKYRDSTPVKKLDFVVKENGTKLHLGIFLDDKYSDISAVIFNPSATIGKVHCINEDAIGLKEHNWRDNNFNLLKTFNEKELIEDGLFIFHNPYAKYPLSEEIFKRDRVCQVFYNKDTKKITKEFGFKHLISRSLPFGVFSKEVLRKTVDKNTFNQKLKQFEEFSKMMSGMKSQLFNNMLKA